MTIIKYSQRYLYFMSAIFVIVGRFAFVLLGISFSFLFWFPKMGAFVCTPKWWDILMCYIGSIWIITTWSGVIIAIFMKCDSCGKHPTIQKHWDFKLPYPSKGIGDAVLNYFLPMELRLRRFQCCHCKKQFLLN